MVGVQRCALAMFRETLRAERWEAVEIRILHVDGSERTVLWNSATIFGPDGNTPMATIAQGQDITKHKQAEFGLTNIETLGRASEMLRDPENPTSGLNRRVEFVPNW